MGAFWKRLIDRFYPRRRYRQTLRAAAAGMGRVRNLPRLLNLIARVIVANVRVTHATIFLRDRHRPYFVVAASQGPQRKPERLLRLEEASPIVGWLHHYREPILYEELRRELKRGRRSDLLKTRERQAQQVVEEMERLQASVCVPSFMDERIKGFLMLGEKLSGERYSQEDLEIFSTLATQAALAIDNAEAYEDLKDTQNQLLQSERLATIGKFASDMAHEIKNPLQAILTFFEYLPERYNDPDFRERFSKIAKQEAQRISDLVKELATYANPKPPQFRLVEISQALDSVLALLENDLHKRRVTVQRGYSHSPMGIEADPDQMKQVFLNLILNALEAISPEEGKENLLEIVAYPNGKVVVVKIRDTGCGIEPQQIPVIFAPFFTTKEKGSGLGLSIVQNILRAHHATMEVESQVGQGTTVTLTMPVRQPAKVS